MMAQECTINHCLELLPFFFVGLFYETNFPFFSSFRSARYEDQYIIRFYKDKLHSMPCQNQVRCITLCV